MTKLPSSVLRALELPDDSSACQLGGESGAPVWQVDADQRRYALRLRPSFQEGAILREASGLQAAHLGNVPTPEVLKVQVAGDYACLLTTWCSGETVASAVLGGRADPVRLGAMCGGVQARIHAVDAPPALAFERGSWLQQTLGEEQLLARVSARRTHCLLHLDYHPLNLLTDGEQITGVVDWVNAGAGDPRLDLARSLALLHLALPADVGPSATALSYVRALADAWIEGYEAVAGPLPQMDVFMAWAGLRTVRDLASKRSPDVVRWMEGMVRSWIDIASG